MWLKANNPFYADVAIDYESLELLPEDRVPDDLPTVEDPESNEDEDAQQEDTEEQVTRQSHSFLPLPQQQQTEQDAISALINRMDPLDWPANDGDPINEFRTEDLASMAFPTLFPFGEGDPAKRTRLPEVSLQTVPNTLLRMQTFQLTEHLLGDLHHTLDFHTGH